MDPLNAFSLACGIIQVVDFSTKVVSTCHKLHKDGSLAANDELEVWTKSLTEICKTLQFPPGQSQNTSSDERELKKLAADCTDTAVYLVNKLQDLKLSSNPRKRDVLRKTLQTMRDKSSLEKIQKQLMTYQKLLDTRILANTRQLLIENQSSQEFQSQTQNSRYQEIANRLLQNEATFEQLRDTIQNQHTMTRQHIDKVFDVHKQATIGQETLERVLESLHFPEIHCREEEIEEAHAQTFEWIFQKHSNKTPSWTDFRDWLENSNDDYWISGKMGSGKSTLMRLLRSDPRTRGALTAWGGNGVISPSFFFWNPGTKLQKSAVGLLRSLIYQISKALPALAPVVAEESETRDVWTASRLRDRFHRLIRYPSLAKHKLCFFIDGLDEFGENRMDLIEMIQKCSEAPNVKFCISSRPYHEFEVGFGKGAMLRLQDLTYHDIWKYTHERILAAQKADDASFLSGSQIRLLGKQITDRADGVFLWVRLAVDDQIAGFRTLDDYETLQKRISALPSKIKDVYSHFLTRIDPLHSLEAAWMLGCTLQDEWERDSFGRLRLSILDLALILYGNLNETLASYTELSVQQILSSCRRTQRRILMLCFGFLETFSGKGSNNDKLEGLAEDRKNIIGYENHYVKVLHRSVADFFRENEAGERFLKPVSRIKGAVLSACIKSSIARIRLHGPLAIHQGWGPHLFEDVLRPMMNLEEKTEKPAIFHVKTLDIAMSLFNRSTQKESESTDWLGNVDMLISHISVGHKLSAADCLELSSRWEMISEARKDCHSSEGEKLKKTE